MTANTSSLYQGTGEQKPASLGFFLCQSPLHISDVLGSRAERPGTGGWLWSPCQPGEVLPPVVPPSLTQLYGSTPAAYLCGA